MAVEHVEVRICDRCNVRHEISKDTERDAWGHLWARAIGADDETHKLQVIGRLTPPGQVGFVDICPSCLDDLMAWWGQRGCHVPVYPDRERDR